MHLTQLVQRVEEGIVAGGGTSLMNVYTKVASIVAEGDEATGINIVLRALEEPVRQIAINAGLEGCCSRASKGEK